MIAYGLLYGHLTDNLPCCQNSVTQIVGLTGPLGFAGIVTAVGFVFGALARRIF